MWCIASANNQRGLDCMFVKSNLSRNDTLAEWPTSQQIEASSPPALFIHYSNKRFTSKTI